MSAHGTDDEVIELGAVAALGLLCVRGVTMWFAILFGCIAWPLWLAFGSRTGLGKVIAWADWNLIVFATRTIFRPLFVGEQALAFQRRPGLQAWFED